MLNDDIGKSRARQSDMLGRTKHGQTKYYVHYDFLQPFNKQGKLPCDYLKRGYEHERSSTLCTQRFCFPFQ